MKYNNSKKPNASSFDYSVSKKSSDTSLKLGPRAPCQICEKNGHSALDCYHKMDFAYHGHHPPSQLVANFSPSAEDDTWIVDSGANHHITGDLSQLQLSSPYQGDDEVVVGNGSGLLITHTGHSSFFAPHSNLKLTNVLHCPHAIINLLSTQKFCYDNNCWYMLTTDFY